MNDRLIAEMIDRTKDAPYGQKAHALIAIVAEHCATICDALADGQTSEKARAVLQQASDTFRAAFVGTPEATPIAQAARDLTRTPPNQ